ncbi:type VI secretion system-associated FHA domain protein TagH [Leisingera daeponensis]|uniref:Type VI secretion system-associated FHA domain protein TagH n=1 Tax=Leisingera daeponensis TaxID=405746 RepID=A0ABS7NIA2_9RHOB|nr:type VI secretion system-associated FHA domain protein TagH [Leisingera daeponensis]MBY6058505.1 type VI secretion system-associated FHA domain protein TagH [Leisingera daeponensis]MBY6140424.1 type VI secretion system-associated FHA domain protein TagH [Leisingera daeponensis]
MGVTLKFQSSGAMPGDAAPVPMRGPSLTVGRGASNDLVLPDPDQMLSRNHCVIEDHNGNVVVVDLSSNGTFLNYSKIPLGRTPTPLNNGDVLCVGNYELVVEIRDDLADVGDMISAPAAQAPASHGNAANAPDPLQLLEDAGPGGDFLDDLLGEGPKGPAQFNPVDPIDELLPPLGEEEDPFFQKASDGREGEGASLPNHNPTASDGFAAPASQSNLIPDDWDDDFLSGIGEPETPVPPSDPQPAEPPREVPQPPSEVPPAAPPQEAPPAPPQEIPPQQDTRGKTAAPSQEAQEAVEAFLKGVGAEVSIDPADHASTMARMGRVMKTLVTGLREILMTRTSIKSEFRIEQTMISAGGNNPLKFSITPEQAVEAMVRPATKGYLSPESAAEEALRDIKAHEVAMVTGMEAALKGVLKRLDPKALEAQIEDKGGFTGLLRGKKARYWDVYEQLYAEISDQAENDFHDLFSREFARAYKDQLDRLKE